MKSASTSPRSILFGLIILGSFTVGCSKDQRTVEGFVLPPGNVEQGKAAFVEIGCPKCHTVANSDIEQPADASFHVEIGGEVRRVKHYGDLLTSVVNPDHKVSRVYRVQDESGQEFSSPMPKFADTMSVTQLIDLVEFLHSTYTSAVPEYGGRYYYYGP